MIGQVHKGRLGCCSDGRFINAVILYREEHLNEGLSKWRNVDSGVKSICRRRACGTITFAMLMQVSTMWWMFDIGQFSNTNSPAKHLQVWLTPAQTCDNRQTVENVRWLRCSLDMFGPWLPHRIQTSLLGWEVFRVLYIYIYIYVYKSTSTPWVILQILQHIVHVKAPSALPCSILLGAGGVASLPGKGWGAKLGQLYVFMLQHC